ncbi:S41 family peptidase [Chitinophaga sp. sic0106]|uniref:S41 family peptidase n=1 Tax=Chitinophaga sp. sic0106 TaxID=2854785 RepID=UPI001C495865|nr:S41 family peptidase [Chitinophaga sp. sic0106]MBV7528718.1 hypothetical protein [Chitinophaga sp. sic0106]
MQPNLLWRLLTGVTMISLLLAACSKDMARNPNTGRDSTAISTNDSIYNIFKDIYLWTDAVPDSATFKPNSYSSPYTMFDSLIGFKKKSNGGNLDKYSFLDDGTTADVLQGHAGDLGFQIGWQTTSELRVVYVYPGSPADKAGIKRGWKMSAVNGTTSFTYGNQATEDVLNKAFSAASANFVFTKPDGTTITSTITSAQYNLNPILFSKVYDLGGSKIGYIVFNSFVALDVVKSQFETIFNDFKTAGVTKVVIDLRYNGGGYVSTAEYLAGKLAPASVANQLMYSTVFNSRVTNKNFNWFFKTMKAVPDYPDELWSEIFYSEATTYAKTNFGATGGLTLTNLSFIMTGNTASSSELLFNVLKPSMNPHMVGSTSYGKPVGFIAVTIGAIDMYSINMQSLNSKNEGDYFDGFTPNVQAGDDYAYDWGSFQDPMLRAALTDMGVPASALGRMAAPESNRLGRISRFYNKANQFKGMIFPKVK